MPLVLPTRTLNGVEIGEPPRWWTLAEYGYDGVEQARRALDGSDRDAISRAFSWADTSQGTAFWDREFAGCVGGRSLSDDARMILQVWLGDWTPPMPDGMTAEIARAALEVAVREPRATCGAVWDAMIRWPRWPRSHDRDNNPPNEQFAELPEADVLSAAWLAVGENPSGEAHRLSPEFIALLRQWAGEQAELPLPAPEGWTPQPWRDRTEEQYFNNHLNALINNGGRAARDNYGDDPSRWQEWQRAMLMGPDEDYDDEDAWAAYDASPAAEAARRASPAWPIYYTRRRNAVRVLVLGWEPLPEPVAPRRAQPDVAVRKPLKRVNVERIKAKYPAVNGATAGCSCGVCASLRKAVDGEDPLTARDPAQIEAAKDYADNGRTFGVEIEGFLPNADAAAAAGINMHAYLALKLTEAGLVMRGMRSNGVWRVKSDASLSGGPRGSTPFELVSPILRGEAGLTEITTATAVLNAVGATVNKSAGLHVHVGAKDLTLAQRRNLLSQFIRYERFFDLILPASRRSNRYAASLRERASATKNKSWKAAEHAILTILAATTEAELSRIAPWHDHHAALSDARGKHGTFEFRQHSGTTNGEKINNWVRLVTAFVEAAKDKPALPFYSRKLSDEEEMEKFFETFSVARDLRAYYRKRHAALFADPNNDD